MHPDCWLVHGTFYDILLFLAVKLFLGVNSVLTFALLKQAEKNHLVKMRCIISYTYGT